MLGKHVIGYIPASIIPALMSFGAVYGYTRLLDPEAYGHYALALNIMTLLGALFFTWLQTALSRLMPQAAREGTAAQLRATAYAAFAGMGGLMLLLGALMIAFAPLGDLTQTAWLALPLALARGLLSVNQAFHRSALNFKRYNIIECGQAVLGFAAGLTLVIWFRLGQPGATAGLIIGMALMALGDWRALAGIQWRDLSLASLRALGRFGLPLTLGYGFAFITSASDRFVIEHIHGAAQVGIYAAGYALIDRLMMIIFMIVALPSFPLTVHRLEHNGIEAARTQTYRNGAALLLLAMPACAGLMLISPQLAAVLIGAPFREGALPVMPWIAGASMLGGLATHYFDHAFHLGKQPQWLLLTQGLTACVNLGLNLTLIPRYGIMGAAYATLAAYAVSLLFSIMIGRRVFPVRFPVKPALQTAAAVAAMAAVLSLIDFTHDWAGLIAKTSLGGGVYAAGILAMNVAGMRERFGMRLLQLRRDMARSD